jgi:hypothetical protein
LIADLALLAILIAPAGFGFPLAARSYPWQRPTVGPYLWFVLVLSAPLLALLILQTFFTPPAGTCLDRPLNDLPLWVAASSIALAIALLIMAPNHRCFMAGIALALCPPTVLWSFSVTMSLAGCWI